MNNGYVFQKPVVSRFTLALLIIYFYFSTVFLPLLSPLRNLGVLEPGLIRNAFLPPLFVALVFSIGLSKVLRPRMGIQLLLLTMFFFAGINGFRNLVAEEVFREYFSHLFQVASAYVMCLAGWLTYRSWSERFWKYFILCALLSTIVSTAFTIGALDRGDIGRYYTAAYGFILIAAYTANASFSVSLLVILGSIISNKRAVVLSVITAFISKIFGLSGKGLPIFTYKIFLINLMKIFIFSMAAIIFFYLFISWINQNPDSGISKAYSISSSRIYDVVNAIGEKSGFEEASSGRVQEIEIALSSMSNSDYFIGSGAGWTIQLHDGRQIQNIHFSPLSIASVYGVPLTIIFYLMIFVIYIKFISLRSKDLTITELMAPIYIVGALVHSFFAYSLFIDWMFFYFIGVLGRSVQWSLIRKREFDHV